MRARTLLPRHFSWKIYINFDPVCSNIFWKTNFLFANFRWRREVIQVGSIWSGQGGGGPFCRLDTVVLENGRLLARVLHGQRRKIVLSKWNNIFDIFQKKGFLWCEEYNYTSTRVDRNWGRALLGRRLTPGYCSASRSFVIFEKWRKNSTKKVLK